MLISRRSFAGGLAAASMAPGKAFSADQRILKIGLSGLPFEKGNAFSNFQTPGILLLGGIFDGLTRMTKQGAVEPWLATSWEAVNDLTWRFTLRDGVVFSNGKPFNAGAVAHTVNYLTGDGPQTEGLRRDFRFLDGAYQIAPEDFEIIESIGGDVASVKDGAVYSVMLQYGDNRETPLNDIRVRQALNYAIDKQTIVDVLLGGRTVVSSQPTVREAYGYDPSLVPYSYDLERAKSLMADAGYPDGFDMSLLTSGGGTNADLVVQRIADDLTRIGVRIDVQQRPVMRFLMDFIRGRIESDAFTLQWGSYPIVDSIQTTNINSCRKVMAPWLCDPTIQPTIDAAWVETDPDLALDLRQEVMGHYREQSPSILLYENIGFVGLGPRIQGFDQTFGYISFETIRFD
jgi:ABC-type transport system substrate-binding protein